MNSITKGETEIRVLVRCGLRQSLTRNRTVPNLVNMRRGTLTDLNRTSVRMAGRTAVMNELTNGMKPSMKVSMFYRTVRLRFTSDAQFYIVNLAMMSTTLCITTQCRSPIVTLCFVESNFRLLLCAVMICMWCVRLLILSRFRTMKIRASSRKSDTFRKLLVILCVRCSMPERSNRLDSTLVVQRLRFLS